MKLIGFDYESYLISEDYPYPKPVCLSYYSSKEEKGIIIGLEDMEAYLSDVFEDDNIVLVAHNLSFELNVTDVWFPNLRSSMRRKLDKGLFICTKVYQQLLDCQIKKPLGKYALSDLVKYYYKRNITASKKGEDAWRLRYHELEGIPLKDWPKEAIEYSIDDSMYTYMCFLKQAVTFVDCKLSIKSDYYLNKIGSKGFKINNSRVLTLESEILDRLIPAYQELYSLGLAEIKQLNGMNKDNKQKYKIVKKPEDKKLIIDNYRELKEQYRIGKKQALINEHIKENIPNVKFTIKGGVATDKEALPSYLAECPTDRVLLVLLKIQEYNNIYNTFVCRLKQVNDVVRCQYTACVSSGRTSCHASKFYPSLNFQQMPKEM